MSKELVTDELWEIIEPLLPPEPPKPRGGRPRVEDRAALAGIIFVIKSGIPCSPAWNDPKSCVNIGIKSDDMQRFTALLHQLLSWS